jgi:hypothetical protein
VHTGAFQAQLSELRLWRRAAGCRWVHFRDVLRFRGAAEISTGRRRDEVDRRVSEDRSAEFGLAQPLGAFPGERRDDSDRARPGRDALEISGLLAARLPDVELRAHPSKYLQRDSPPLGVAPEARLVSARSLRELRRAWLRSDAKSDVQLPREARTESQRFAPERHSVKQLRVRRWLPLALARERALPQALREVVQPPAQPVSTGPLQAPLPEQLQAPGARFSLSLLRSSPLPPLLPLLPDQGNVFLPARRAQYQSNSSASSSL